MCRYSWVVLFMIGCVMCLNLYLMSLYLTNIEYGHKNIKGKKLFTDTIFPKKGMGDSSLTLYGHYTQGGIKSGLTPTANGFLLNGKNITIFSGAIHYFRVHPHYWRDRLRKLRAAGFVAVETYVPWNLHEPGKDTYDFGDGGHDMSMFLDVAKYVQLAKEEDLFVLVRPGPYICAEWDFGGMPSWLLRDPQIKVRTSNEQFMDRVTRYFDKLLPVLSGLQFADGGSIIGFQIENEYGRIAAEVPHPDEKYQQGIKALFEKHGLGKSMFYTSDVPSATGTSGALDGDTVVPPRSERLDEGEGHTNNTMKVSPLGVALKTLVEDHNPDEELTILAQLQPKKPLMVMEYWTGWFDHWFESHHIVPTANYCGILESILKFPSSVNLYMFHGGTNFGFMNGANVQADFPTYQPDVTSFDYDALLSESGDYTVKYHATAQLVKQYNPIKTVLPDLPAPTVKVAYPPVAVSHQMDFNTLVDNVPEEDRVKSTDLVPMELLDINHGNGQSYGFVLYRTEGMKLPGRSVLRVKGKVRDHAVVLVDGNRETPKLTREDQLEGFGFWEQNDSTLTLSAGSAGPSRTLDVLVENWGRVNYDTSLATFDQRKGLVDCSVFLDDRQLRDWRIIALQFKSNWITSLTGWQDVSPTSGPALYKAYFDITTPQDTFIDMSAWGKGNVFVNGFNIGRYFSGGPSRTMYLPAPFLVTGKNQIMIFELFSPSSHVVFSAVPILG